MGRISEGKQKTYPDRFKATSRDLVDDTVKVVFVKWSNDATVLVNPLFDFKDIVPSDQGRDRRRSRVIHVFPVHATHHQGVLKPLRSYEAHIGALPLKEGIRRNGGAVHETVQTLNQGLVRFDGIFRGRDRRQHTCRDVARYRRNFLNDSPAAILDSTLR